MRSVKSFTAAAAAVLLPSIFSFAAFAADMPIAAPPYAPIVEDFGGWYLRGDVGLSNQRVRRLDTPAYHAGLGYKATPSLTLEFAYSYVNLGDAVTGPLFDFLGFTRGRTMEFKDMTSHDLKFGVRWNLEDPAGYAPSPAIRKG